jgi:transcription elongation regulator 1
VQDLKKGIREDPRYTKFSSSEKKCEKEFIAWLKDKTMKARDDYKQLLQVSSFIFCLAGVQVFSESELLLYWFTSVGFGLRI